MTDEIITRINRRLEALTEENPRLLVPDVFGRINSFSLDSLVRSSTLARTLRSGLIGADLKKTFSQNTTEFSNMFSFKINDLSNQQAVNDGVTFRFDFRGVYRAPIGFTIWNRITSYFSDGVVSSSQKAEFVSLTIRGVLTFSVSNLTPYTNPITGQTTFAAPRSPVMRVYNIRWGDLSIEFPPTTRIVHAVEGTEVSATLDKDLTSVIKRFSPDLYRVLSDELNLRFAGVYLSV